MKSSSCRLRKVACADCGYTARIARSWMTVGLPSCPCGGTLEPAQAADRAFCGLLSAEDVPAVVWTAICRENGWEDSIIRRGAAAKAFERHELEAGGFAGRVGSKPQCSYPGCGKWTASDAEYCSAHDHEAAALPF